MMRYDGSGTYKTYVTFRVSGDTLDPNTITKILRVVPTVSYAKGEEYFAGQRTGKLIGKTGMWNFTTDKLVASNDLQYHLAYILGILIPGRQDASPLVHLHALLAKNEGIRADLRCFWHGHAGAKKPSIPKIVTEFVKIIPASIATDFDTDSVSDNGRKIA